MKLCPLSWVAGVKGLKLMYSNKEAFLFTVYPYSGKLVQVL